MNNYVLALAVAAGALVGAAASAQAPAPNAQFQSIFKEIVETDSSVISGSCTAVTEKVAARLKAAGFADADIHLSTPETNPKAGNLVVIYPGKDPKAKAVLMLGHIDVVNAKRSDWTRDPYVMVEEGGYFYARGVADMKAQDAIWIDNLLRFKAEGYRPLRTIKMALTCGEEGGGFVNGAGWLVEHQRELIDAGIALTEGGGGDYDDSGKEVALTVLAAEKSGGNFKIEVTNPGGHSSRPRPDNAIYTMSRAMDKIAAFDFPVEFNDANRAYFSRMANIVGGEDSAAMKAILANPSDPAANARLNKSPQYHAMLRTVCGPTGIEGGHAPNAMPQSVTVNLNCRIMPNTSSDAVHDALVKAVNDPEVKIYPVPPAAPVPLPPLTPKVMSPIDAIAAKIYPGVPVVPMQTTGGTDAKRTNGAGIPTYGVSGIFRDPDGGGAHGLNERVRIATVYEARDFLYTLIKTYADQK